ncbi:MAG: hypothetical protein KDC98_06755 [Planctomycetes bacterium]|nr:hypothetical protein [Planctomycetota bacterium]
MLEEFLGRAKTAPIYQQGWVDVMIDVDRDTNGKAINERLKGERGGGLPWMVILDPDGKEIVSSNAEADGKNIGGPRSPEECAWFGEMMRRSRGDKVSEAEVRTMIDDLEDYSAPQRRPRKTPPPPPPAKPATKPTPLPPGGTPKG